MAQEVITKPDDVTADIHPQLVDGLYIPRRVTIETIFGCNASCTMCPIDIPTERPKGRMPKDRFEGIIDALTPYREYIEMMDLFALGEPLLDQLIFDRIRYAKESGFRNLAISTNAHALRPAAQRKLLESGIDTVLFSIDGAKKETHEAIRRRLDFDKVVKHCREIIHLRDEGNYKTRFVIRFIRQDSNRTEWDEFERYWSDIISPDKRDFVTAYDVHTMGDGALAKDDVLGCGVRDDAIEQMACYQVFEILYILANGVVPLCSEDWLHPEFAFGNVDKLTPIEIFNSERFNQIRRTHLEGRKNCMSKCDGCSVLYSRMKSKLPQQSGVE